MLDVRCISRESFVGRGMDRHEQVIVKAGHVGCHRTARRRETRDVCKPVRFALEVLLKAVDLQRPSAADGVPNAH
jgi:hypothetical protein